MASAAARVLTATSRETVKRRSNVFAAIRISRTEVELFSREPHGRHQRSSSWRGIWAYVHDRTSVPGVTTYVWSDNNISDFIDSL
jgi:hypothetical protein